MCSSSYAREWWCLASVLWRVCALCVCPRCVWIVCELVLKCAPCVSRASYHKACMLGMLSWKSLFNSSLLHFVCQCVSAHVHVHPCYTLYACQCVSAHVHVHPCFTVYACQCVSAHVHVHPCFTVYACQKSARALLRAIEDVSLSA